MKSTHSYIATARNDKIDLQVKCTCVLFACDSKLHQYMVFSLSPLLSLFRNSRPILNALSCSMVTVSRGLSVLTQFNPCNPKAHRPLAYSSRWSRIRIRFRSIVKIVDKKLHLQNNKNASFEVFKAVTRVTAIFRNMTPCVLAEASVHCYYTTMQYIRHYSNLHIVRQLCSKC